MNKLTLFFFGLIFSTTALSQAAESVLIMAAEGELYFTPVNGERIRIYTGYFLRSEGTLELAPAARAELIHKERFVQLDRPGKHQLSALFPEAAGSGGFLSRFSTFVGRGLDQSASKKNLEKAHLTLQGNARGNTRGMLGGSLDGTRPFGGVLAAETVAFSWPPTPDAAGYTLDVVDSLTEETVLRARTQGPRFRVDIGDLALSSGRTYFWTVVPVNTTSASPTMGLGRRGAAAAVTSDRVYFRYADRNTEAVLADFREDPNYPNGSSTNTRTLAELMVLEELGMVTAADRMYRTALGKSTDNTVLRRSYAAFLARWNLPQEAEAQRLEAASAVDGQR